MHRVTDNTTCTDGSDHAGVDRSIVKRPAVKSAHGDIYSLLKSRGEATPAPVAVEAEGFFDLTGAGLLRRVQQLMVFLRRDISVERQDTVAIVLPNGPEMAVALLGVSSAAVCAPLNPSYTVQEFQDSFARLGARFIILPQGEESAALTAARRSKLTIVSIPVRLPTDRVLKFLRPVLKNPCPRRDYVPPEDEPFNHDVFESTASVHPSPDDRALVLQTSGTTSRPKIVPLTHGNICKSVELICDSLELDGSNRCLGILPQFHIGGLVDLLLVPLASGGTSICANSLDTHRFFRFLQEYRPTWFQAVPTILYDIVAYARQKGELPCPSSLEFIRSVSAPLPSALLEEVEDTFQVPVIEMYGMTEAGPMICSNPRSIDQRRPGSVGKPYVEELAVVDAQGEIVPRGKQGEIIIRGDNVITAYAGDDESDRSPFRGGWFHTGDLGYLDREDYLYLRGRVKEIINRGGEKISPLEVDHVLLEHPAVAEAVSFPVPHPTLGENIAAAVVLRPEARAGERELQAHVASCLAAFKVPHRIRIVDSIPRGPTGKIQRLHLADAVAWDSESEYVSPRNEMEETLVEIWEEVLKVDRVGVRDDFFDLGGHSLLAVELIGVIERRLGFRIPDEAMFHLSTVENMAISLIDSTAGATANVDSQHGKGDDPELRGDLLTLFRSVIGGCSVPSLSRDSLMLVMNVDGGHVPLYWCFNAPEREMPGLGNHLGPDYPLYGMYSGGQVCEYTHKNVMAAASTYLREVLSLQDKGPFLIGGNCRGGSVSLEIASRLIAMGKEDVRLCLLEFFHPDVLTYTGPVTLLYGKDSPDQLQKRFNWGQPGWADRFSGVVTVHMLDGEYGKYWHGERARMFSKVIAGFIENTL